MKLFYVTWEETWLVGAHIEADSAQGAIQKAKNFDYGEPLRQIEFIDSSDYGAEET